MGRVTSGQGASRVERVMPKRLRGWRIRFEKNGGHGSLQGFASAAKDINLRSFYIAFDEGGRRQIEVVQAAGFDDHARGTPPVQSFKEAMV